MGPRPIPPLPGRDPGEGVRAEFPRLQSGAGALCTTHLPRAAAGASNLEEVLPVLPPLPSRPEVSEPTQVSADQSGPRKDRFYSSSQGRRSPASCGPSHGLLALIWRLGKKQVGSRGRE